MARDGVEVAVLGPVEVRGAASPFRRAASLDLVVYLALHRRSVSHAEWALALWPERTVSASTLYSTASDLRRALGSGSDGVPHLNRGGALRLRATVRTDVELLGRLARSADPEEAIRALALVRGPVLTGLRRADWAVFDGTKAGLQSEVVRAAAGVADVLLRHGRPDDAECAVRRALVVSPYDERLYRALLRATAAQGSRVRLHATMAELRAMAAECDSTASPGHGMSSGTRAVPSPSSADPLHPSTTGLYRDLLLRPAAVGSRPARL